MAVPYHLASALFFAVLVTVCSAQPYNIGFIHAEESTELTVRLPELLGALQTNYSSFFGEMRVLNANLNSVTQANLTGLDAVLVWADWTFAQPDELGNALVDFADAGGGVVIAAFSTAAFTPVAEYVPGGSWFANYGVLVPSPDINSAEVQKIYWAEHPVVNGITNVTSSGYGQLNLTSGSYALGRFTSGTIFAAVRDAVGPAPVNRVDLVVWPEAGLYYANQILPYSRLIVQALEYTIAPNNYLVVDTSACSMPNITELLNTAFTLDPAVVITQSIPEGTALSGTVSVAVTATLAGSGTISRTATINSNCGAASSLETASWTPLLNAFSFVLGQ